jgi:uncharacterized protein (TIGR03790 family)
MSVGGTAGASSLAGAGSGVAGSALPVGGSATAGSAGSGVSQAGTASSGGGAAGVGGSAGAAGTGPSADFERVAVVVNDESPTSVKLGQKYTELRGVTNVVHVSCDDSAANQDNETISFDDYTTKIEAKLRSFLTAHASVQLIVTTKGVPIRITGAATGEAFSGDTQTSLDSYIAALDYDKLPGVIKVTFNDPDGSAVGTAWENRYYQAQERFDHAKHGGYLVTRLDGYTLEDALALTTHAIAAEKKLEAGKVLFDVEPDFGLGDANDVPAQLTDTNVVKEADWSSYNGDMARAAALLQIRGVGSILDQKTNFVGNQTNLLGYFSWGSNDSHFSQQAYDSNTFVPGALGDTAVSTSARSFFHQEAGQSQIADLIAQGITGVKGYTDEPLLQANASPSVLFERYSSGWTLAESYYAAARFVGWTDVIIGDPLTKPFPALVEQVGAP